LDFLRFAAARSSLAASLDEEALAFRRNRHGRDYVVGSKASMQLPEVAAAFANFLETSGKQVAANTPATQGLSCAIGNAHCRFSFAAGLVESKSRIGLTSSPTGCCAAWRLQLIRQR
jgi:hypothetical protein